MIASMLITLREGLEAALIIGIILAYLAKTGNRQAFKPVWIGVALAVAVSMIVGGIIFWTAGEFSGKGEEIFEGIAMFVAVGVLTWMIFWMRKQAAGIKAHLHSQIDSALGNNSIKALVILAFVVVVREGIETALFLFASTRVSESTESSLIGGLIGLAIAIAIGYAFYRGSARLNLKTIFNVTGLLLIVFAAGLLAHGIHEFHEAGLIPTGIEHVWNINHIIDEKSTVGAFLKALVGYNGNPSLVEVIAYVVFLTTALAAFLRPWKYIRRQKSNVYQIQKQVR
ncbi:MAG: iron transporter [Chloroflexi bacterium]|jgi:high-affinity iron transporter|nr:iron transporter [Chloroflexota bacterium]MBT7079919.1 iron transporter [Chloroflexota bacterium]MBT7290107.1 iron transporter [Chloroflexota bacterium]